jgi:glutamate racemase
MSERPIGIFDSGIGGLTVCKAINDIMPHENLIYFGDTARFPYGTRSKETIIRYSTEIKDYLLSRDVKMIVIACNTASAAALEELQKNLTIPIIGVIEAGAKAAVKDLNGDTIGVIATRATIKSESYIKSINKINPKINIVQQQASLFVALTEEGMIDNEISRLTVKEYLKDINSKKIKTLILGCTHFPLLKKTINDVYPDINLIDTGTEIALEVKQILKEKNLAINSISNNKGTIELFASDITETLLRLKSIFFHKKDIALSKLIINGKINEKI